jgi:hypothetical protein
MKLPEAGKAIHIDEAEQSALLAEAVILHEVDSGMCGPIRLIQLPDVSGVSWILEQDLKRRPVLRQLLPEQDGRAFIEDRLNAYDRMWDG